MNKNIVYFFFFIGGVTLTYLLVNQIELSLRQQVEPKEFAIDYSGGIFYNIVFIGSSECIFCNSNFSEAYNRLVKKLKENQQSIKYPIYFTGVSVDADLKRGHEYLYNVSDFDETIIGMGWYNIAAFEYVWDTNNGITGIPQILFYEIEYTVDGNGLINSIASNRKLLRRIMNLNELQEFINLPIGSFISDSTFSL